jgi:hypothetical protein
LRRVHRLGLRDPVVITKLSSRRSGRGVYSFITVVLCVFVSSACASSAPNATSTPLPRQVKIARLKGQPLEAILPKLYPDNRAYLEAFAATIPITLPELAIASSVFLEPTSSSSSDMLIVKRSENEAEVEIGQANAGSNAYQPNVLCLRNGVQVGCTPEVDVWEVELPPKTMVLMPTRIPANPGDRLTFLFLPDNEPKRLEAGSQMLRAEVEQHPDSPTGWVDAPTVAKVLGGCDFAVLVKDLSDTTSPLNLFRNSTTKRGTILYLLIQLCNPTGQEYIQLVPIVDRTTVADLPGEIWHLPVRLASAVSAIPVDTAQLGLVNEFQIAVVPISLEAASALHHRNFTQAVEFSN